MWATVLAFPEIAERLTDPSVQHIKKLKKYFLTFLRNYFLNMRPNGIALGVHLVGNACRRLLRSSETLHGELNFVNYICIANARNLAIMKCLFIVTRKCIIRFALNIMSGCACKLNIATTRNIVWDTFYQRRNKAHL